MHPCSGQESSIPAPGGPELQILLADDALVTFARCVRVMIQKRKRRGTMLAVIAAAAAALATAPSAQAAATWQDGTLATSTYTQCGINTVETGADAWARTRPAESAGAARRPPLGGDAARPPGPLPVGQARRPHVDARRPGGIRCPRPGADRQRALRPRDGRAAGMAAHADEVRGSADAPRRKLTTGVQTGRSMRPEQCAPKIAIASAVTATASNLTGL